MRYLAILFLLIFGLLAHPSPTVAHPLDSLKAQEYVAIAELLEKKGLSDQETRYPFIQLQPPSKDKVWQSQAGLPRKALVVTKQGTETYQGVVNLTENTVESWEHIPQVQPGILAEEWENAQEIVVNTPQWQEAARKRGFESFEDIVCIPLSAGYFNAGDIEARRVLKVPCYDSRQTQNFWGRPLEGLIAVVDIGKGETLKVIDTGVKPIPNAPIDLDADSVGELREVSSQRLIGKQPLIKLEGQEVSWQNWNFHFRLDPRVGPIISTVTYDQRPIMYEGHLSEMFVPYMHPETGWYFRTYMDAGEYGAGKLSVPLEVGSDCPADAVYIDAVYADDRAQPYLQPRSACLFVRDAGNIAWRHYEGINGQSESRPAQELVLRFIDAIGNYDYLFDWVFTQAGAMKVKVGASGIEQVEAVTSASLADAEAKGETAYGRLVAPHTVAINHDHFFNFRLDLDVDGMKNSVVRDRLESRSIGAESPRTSIWEVAEETLTHESEAKLNIDLSHPSLWRAINPKVTNVMGNPVSYELKGEANTVSLLAEDDYPQRRAGFIQHHLWVTPYEPEERYAAGMYPNQSRGEDGLPTWTKRDRSLENQDIVLWYTLGHHHLVRTEDWPVLPTAVQGFELRPFDFFDRNPALDLPPLSPP